MSGKGQYSLSVVLLALLACTSGCVEEDYLVGHNTPSEMNKKQKYGFEGSGIPGSPEMIELTQEWVIMNRSVSKQRGRDRFDENKYGMFIHWDLYSRVGSVWNGKKMENSGKGSTVAEWVMLLKFHFPQNKSI